MRPTPSEVIEGVRRTLRDLIEPALDSEHARKQLREIRAVLAQVDWDDAGFALADRNRRLGAALDAVRSWVDEDAARRASFSDARGTLDDLAEPTADSFARHNAYAARLAGAAAALVDPLADWLAAHVDDEAAGDLRRRLITALE